MYDHNHKAGQDPQIIEKDYSLFVTFHYILLQFAVRVDTKTTPVEYINISPETQGVKALEFTHFLNSGDAIAKTTKKMRHPFDGFR
jgi:hypothetical protein